MPAHKIIDSVERYRAYRIVFAALQSGKLTRQPCSVCGDKGQAHHEDYSKPLELTWLCRKHHYARHVEMRREAIERKREAFFAALRLACEKEE